MTQVTCKTCRERFIKKNDQKPFGIVVEFDSICKASNHTPDTEWSKIDNDT